MRLMFSLNEFEVSHNPNSLQIDSEFDTYAASFGGA